MRGWDEFFAFINLMPDSTKTKALVNEDEEYAQSRISYITNEDIDEILDKRANNETSDDSITTEGYTMEIEKLNQVIDTVNMLSATVKAGFGAKGNDLTVKRAKRPETAYQRLLKDKIYEREREQKDELLSDLGF